MRRPPIYGLSGLFIFDAGNPVSRLDAGFPASLRLPLRRLEKSMEKIEYRIKPVTRYVVTCHKQSESSGSCGPVGEFQNSKTALQIAEALAQKDGGTLITSPEYNAAIAQLIISAETCESNAPIWEAEGNREQAELSRKNAAAYRAAISVLSDGISSGQASLSIDPPYY
jgi:hypothetical protein